MKSLFLHHTPNQEFASPFRWLSKTNQKPYSHPQINGTVNHHQISRDSLFHLGMTIMESIGFGLLFESLRPGVSLVILVRIPLVEHVTESVSLAGVIGDGCPEMASLFGWIDLCFLICYLFFVTWILYHYTCIYIDIYIYICTHMT